MILIRIILILKKMKSKVLETTIINLLESLDHTSNTSEYRALLPKSVLLWSIAITSNNQGNKSSGKTLKSSVPTFSSKQNSNDIKEHVPPIKDDFIDFCIDGTAIKSDNTENKSSFKKRSV